MPHLNNTNLIYLEYLLVVMLHVLIPIINKYTCQLPLDEEILQLCFLINM